MTFDEFLRQACPPQNLEWRKYRRRAARRRVQHRMRELGVADYEAYLERLRSDPAEATGLADRMRITVTRFFRERDRWELLAETVFPALLNARKIEEPIRAWSAGCAGGEEPYSLAILWLSEISPLFPRRSLRILATDIDRPSLARAEEAVYASGELREIPKNVRDRFFRRRDGQWSPIPEVTRMVDFSCHNLVTEAPPGRFDLVFSRYLPFTYFTSERRLKAACRLRQALLPEGALMIGAREDLGPAASLFTPWPEAPGFFRPAGCAPALQRGSADPMGHSIDCERTCTHCRFTLPSDRRGTP